MNENKVIKSHYGVELRCEVISQNSNTLVVLLPGIGYTLDRSLMDYSRNIALEKGYDVLPLEYGFQLTRNKIDKDDMDEVKILIDESFEILKMSSYSKYEKIIFIGKSIGTVVQRILEDRIIRDNYHGEILNVHLTPINKTCELGIKENSLVVSGDKDTFISDVNREKLSIMEKVKYIEIEDAGHSLNIKNNTLKSIEALNRVISAEKEFI